MIEVQNLEKKFGDFVAVDKINFSLQSGDILGFLGPLKKQWCRKINSYEETQWRAQQVVL